MALTLGGWACTKNPTISLDDCDIVATRKIVGSDTVIVCEQELVKQYVTIPLSHLVEDWKLVKLENGQAEAMVIPYQLYPSENYLFVIPSSGERGILAFDTQGNYIQKIGKEGKGFEDFQPGPYQIQIDETNDYIYVRDLNPERILKFRISDGAYLGHVPLSINRCSEIWIKDSLMIVTRGPHHQIDEIGKFPLLWLQNMKGEKLQEVSSVGWGHRLAFLYYLWERNGNITFCTSNADTLYHYNLQENRLIPRFTMKRSEECHHPSLEDVSDYYLFMSAESVPNDFGHWYLPQKRIIVDKKTLKGAYVDIVLDGYGDISITDKWFYLNGSYLMMNLQPMEVAAICKAALDKKEDMTLEEEKRVRKLLSGIKEDDNSFVLFGKIK